MREVWRSTLIYVKVRSSRLTGNFGRSLTGCSQGALADSGSLGLRDLFQYCGNGTGPRALTHGHQRALFAVGGLVGDNGVELSLGKGDLVNPERRADVCGAEEPCFRVDPFWVLPRSERTKLVFVLFLKLFDGQFVGLCNGSERDRFGLCFILLQNWRTPVPVWYQETSGGGHA